jgi:hypothetical protein
MRACGAVARRHVLTLRQIADIHRQRAREDDECFLPELWLWRLRLAPRVRKKQSPGVRSCDNRALAAFF